MTDPRVLSTIENYLRTELFPDIDPQSQRILLGLYRLVATTKPVSLEHLAATVDIDFESVKKRIDTVAPSRLQYDEAGRIIAFAGLSQIPASHCLTFEGRQLFTWCTFDTLVLPQLLGGEAKVSSHCPVTNDEIRLTVTPEGPREVTPGSTMMSFVMPEAKKCCDDLRGSFCNYVNFLASPEAGKIWQQSNENAVILTLNEAFNMGRVRNNACFKDVLNNE